ncbi:Gfo/Idh/MocA family protein [Amycolatopsis sp.]|uniref:Gfo/Idh/MocA family protein n=1 Tax=Amycolatopsis sp. TaxID=37632 RepID=UPI002C93E26B|nr:Gfo/Idh/MocA family oxidoreductase [Amycolatopsis sp.]HVV11451.1 Gfo/Idh/MocA family oxidoreductase [Amycolatopsis sp.]
MVHAKSGPIRTAVIGFGVAGRVFHAPFLSALDEFSLDAVVTADPARRAEVGSRYPATRVVTSADELFGHAEDFDLVVIATPPGTHAPLARIALSRRLAVVVDKPFATTAEEGQALVEEAARQDVALTVYQNRRWDGDFRTVRQLVGDGRLGEVRRFESRFEWWKPQPRPSWKTRATVAAGGGILFDLGTHVIDQALQLFGDAEVAHFELHTRRDGGTADDDAFVVLRHFAGVTSHLWMNSLAPQPGPRFRVQGSAATYVKSGLDPQEARLANGFPATSPGIGADPESHWGTLGAGPDLERIPTLPGDYAGFYRALADSLSQGAPLPVDPSGPLRVLRLIQAMLATIPSPGSES